MIEPLALDADLILEQLLRRKRYHLCIVERPPVDAAAAKAGGRRGVGHQIRGPLVFQPALPVDVVVARPTFHVAQIEHWIGNQQ